jgi:hypothetical protein
MNQRCAIARELPTPPSVQTVPELTRADFLGKAAAIFRRQTSGSQNPPTKKFRRENAGKEAYVDYCGPRFDDGEQA